MAEDSTTAPAPIDAEALQRAIAALQPPTQVPVPTEGGPATHGIGGFLSDVGTALSGGQTGLLGLSPDEQASAGRHALLRFGIDMLAASGKSYAPKDFGSVLAAGLGGAQQAQQESENRAYVGRGASQQLAQQAFQNRIAAIKEAIPLLQLQQRASLPNPFAQGGDGKPGTSIADAAADPVTALPREQALDALAQRESGWKNVPNAEGGDASGYWQIRDATWRDGAKLAGVDVSKYPRAIDAPKDVQRQVAGAIYDRDGAKPWAASAPGRGVAARTGGTDYAGPGAGGGTTAAPTAPALPLPPEPPAEGIPVPGGSGMRVYPDGKIGTPGQEGRPPATQVATADTGTKTDATPAPVATTPAPGAPRDTTGLKDEELSLPEFQQRYRTPLAPDAGVVKVNPQVQADRQAAVAAAQKSVTQAQQGMRAAEQDWTVQRDDKSLQARSAAQQRLETAQQNLQTAQQNANKLSQDAETETVKNRQAAQQEQDKQLAATYKDLRDRAATAAEAERNRQAQIALETQKGEEARKTAAAASENSFVLDTRKKLTDERSAAQETVDNLGLLDNLSKAAGAATPLDSLSWGGMPLRQWLLQKNLGSPEQIARWGAQQAYEAAINQTVIGLRKGVSMGALSDRDLSFLQGMSPSVLQRPDTREAVTAYLRSAQLRKIRFADSVDELWDGGKGMSYGQALIAARRQLPDIVPQIPAGASNADKRDWFTKNVPAGTLYRNARGDLTVWPGMPSDQPQVPRD